MKNFEFNNPLNQKGLDIIASYENLMNFSGNAFMKEALEKSLRHEGFFASYAIDNRISVEDFTKRVIESGRYKPSYSNIQEAAIAFVSDIIKDFDVLVDIIPVGRTKIAIQKRVGMKASTAMKYFDVSQEKMFSMINSGFLNTFVDTYIRKKINLAVSNFNHPYISLEISDVYNVRKYFYDINVNFVIKIDDLNDEVIGYALSEINHMNNFIAEFD